MSRRCKPECKCLRHSNGGKFCSDGCTCQRHKSGRWHFTKDGRSRREVILTARANGCAVGGAKVRPSLVRKMTEPERAWLGAFIEADGCAFVRHFSDGRRKRLVLNIGQKIIEPIAVALRITQVGFVQLGSVTEQWAWTVGRMNDVLAVAEQCYPYSWKIQRALKEFGQED